MYKFDREVFLIVAVNGWNARFSPAVVCQGKRTEYNIAVLFVWVCMVFSVFGCVK